MKSNLLYPLVLLGVLMTVGCGERNGSESIQPARDSIRTSGSEGLSSMENELNADNESMDVTGAEDQSLAPGQTGPYRVVFLGDSITAGFGVDEEDAFPNLVRQRIEERGLPFQVIDAGISGDTSAGGLSRIGWLLRNRVDVLVLELGGNDALRGIDLTTTRVNLSGIVSATLERYPNCRIIVAGMMVPPNLGHEYTETFRLMYPSIAAEYDASLIPFVLEGVGGVPEMMQSDGIHPNAAGHARTAETVWKYLEPVLADYPDSVE